MKLPAKQVWQLSLVMISISAVGVWLTHRSPSSTPGAVGSAPSKANSMPALEPTLQYKAYELANSTIYTLKIPVSRQFEVTPALSNTVDTVVTMARQHGAIAALNGGFFDPETQQSTAYVVLNGKQVADPRQNDHLMHNPNLTPYLSKILNRTEFRQYQCGDRRQFAIALHSDPTPTGCQLINALGGGPQLLPQITAQQEGFTDYANGNVIRDALGIQLPNARSAIGLTQDGSILWVMAAQKPNRTARGMTLQALADFMKTLDVEQAMNLDGGSSSSFYYNGKTFDGKRDEAGNPLERPVKSVLLVNVTPK